MSKKSRRRNKKILGLLGVLGAGLIASRNKGTAAANVNSGRGGDSSSALARVKANTPDVIIPKKKAAPVIADTKVDTPYISTRMRGKGDMSGSAGQEIRAGLSEPTSVNVDMAEGSPMIDNSYNSRNIRGRLTNRAFKSGGRAKLKSGGKVKGCGKALRGYGRAMKGKK